MHTLICMCILYYIVYVCGCVILFGCILHIYNTCLGIMDGDGFSRAVYFLPSIVTEGMPVMCCASIHGSLSKSMCRL